MTHTHTHVPCTHSHTHTHSPSAAKDHGYESTLAACERSLQALGRPCLDLYLIQWPGVDGKMGSDPQNAIPRKESWRALEELSKKGKTLLVSANNLVKL